MYIEQLADGIMELC